MQIPTLPKLLHLASVLVFSLVYWFLLSVFLQLREILRHTYFQFYMSHRDMNFEVKIYPPQIQKQNQSISRLNLAKKLLTIWYGPESVEWDVSRASGVHIFPVFLNFPIFPYIACKCPIIPIISFKIKSSKNHELALVGMCQRPTRPGPTKTKLIISGCK